MKKFVRIQSEKNIEVTPDLQYIDMTNPDAHVGDRLRVAGQWIQMRVLIRKGTGLYPSCVQNWSTVKSLEKGGVLTVGEETDECTDEETLATAHRLELAQRNYEQRKQAALADQERASTVHRMERLLNDYDVRETASAVRGAARKKPADKEGVEQ